MRHGVDVDLVFGLLDAGRDGLRAQLEPIGAADQHGVVVQPHQRRLELVRDLRRILGGRDDIAARAVDLVGEGQRDRLARHGLVEVAREGHDPLERGGLARGQHAQGRARLCGPAGDEPGESAKVEIGAVDPLHRHPERLVLRIGGIELDGLEMLDQRGTGVPEHVVRRAGDVVALEARDRHGGEALDPDLGGEARVIGDDRLVGRLIVIDQIHLVDRQHDPANPQPVAQEAVPPGLDQHALARIDQDHRQLGGGGAGDHVAGVLLVAGAIGDDELAPVGRKEAIGDVDGDALLALGGQPVDQQRVVELLPLRADPFAVALETGELVLEDHLAVVEQPPDQRRLAVVDAAAGDEAQHGLVLMAGQIGVDVLTRERIGTVGLFGAGLIGHQK